MQVSLGLLRVEASAPVEIDELDTFAIKNNVGCPQIAEEESSTVKNMENMCYLLPFQVFVRVFRFNEGHHHHEWTDVQKLNHGSGYQSEVEGP